MNTRKLTETALMVAIIAILSPLSIPLAGEVPISLATFTIMLAGVLLGPRQAVICTALYLFIGAIGIPVFAQYTSGVGILFGVTGGFLFGYLPLAFFSGLFSKGKIRMFIGMFIGNAILYLFGIIWFMYVTQASLMTALLACVIPFLPGDLLKIILVYLLAPRLQPIIHKNR